MEYHHEKPYGKGGQHEAGNIALRCRAHNQYQADLDFGREFMRDKRHGNRPHSARNARDPLARAEIRRHRRLTGALNERAAMSGARRSAGAGSRSSGPSELLAR